MPSGTELDVLKTAAAKGRETTALALAPKLVSWNIDYIMKERPNHKLGLLAALTGKDIVMKE